MKKINFTLAVIKPAENQLDKIHEEFLELSSAPSADERLEEAFDLLQATATLINSFSTKKVRQFKRKHLQKMEKYLKCGRVKSKTARGYTSPDIEKIADEIICNKKKYRPFKDGADLITYYQAMFSYRHGTPAIWVMDRDTGYEYLITGITQYGVEFANGDYLSYNKLAEDYYFPLASAHPAARWIGDLQ